MSGRGGFFVVAPPLLYLKIFEKDTLFKI